MRIYYHKTPCFCFLLGKIQGLLARILYSSIAAKKKYYSQDLASLIKYNPKIFWHDAKQTTLHDAPLHYAKQTPLSDEASAIAFNAYFATVFTKEDCSSVSFVPDQPFPFMTPINITAEGIANLSTMLKVSISSDINNINSDRLKNTTDISSSFLSLIFNQSLSSGELPKDWKIGKVVPVIKSGDRHSPRNYRPISLTCTSC